MTESESLLILNSIPGLTNHRIKKFLNLFRSAKRILLASVEELSTSGFPLKVIENIQQFPKDSFLKKEYNFLNSQKVRVVNFLEKEYPSRLKEIPDCPLVLYIKGDIDSLANSPAVAMVGSRQASLYGLAQAQILSSQLAGLGIHIVSGLAKGIDTACHRGALRVKGATTAVLASGLNCIYPPENQKLAEDIVQAGGCLISELSMETLPVAYHFPRRNRIISGLALGVIVVEASEKSGALITANFALEQGREVFAVPGNISQTNSKGVHRLIKDGAKLVGSIEDVLEELQLPLSMYGREESGSKTKTKRFQGDPVEEGIYEFLAQEPAHLDSIAAACGQPVATLGNVLLKMELKKAVKQLPGKMFARFY